MAATSGSFQWTSLYRPPAINPINGKARSIPILNPINKYGRVFFFSWFGFMVAFWAWYAFPPLLTATIKDDLHLTTTEVANSNIASLCATLLVRVAAGPFCDRFGPRKVFGGLLLLGAIPTGLAPLIHTASGLYAVRFFMGILGGSFVPCQVWSTAFFDKNVVGSANAMAGGFGNAGGGMTYFIMPAIFNALVDHQGYSKDVAWRLAFLVPLAVLLATAAALLLLCPDTPDGPWADRHSPAQRHLCEIPSHRPHQNECHRTLQEDPKTVHATESFAEIDSDKRFAIRLQAEPNHTDTGGQPSPPKSLKFSSPPSCPPSPASSQRVQPSSPYLRPTTRSTTSHEVRLSSMELLETCRSELGQPPTAREALRVAFSPQTWALMLSYLCPFGAELAINAVLSAYYLQTFPSLGQTGASHWAALFGTLNIVTRPMGGVVADLLYAGHRLLWKRHWITACGLLSGVSLVTLGCSNLPNEATMFGLVALCAVFLEAGNGANFALVPHVHPFANGLVSGLTAAAGNVGGILFSIVFRLVTTIDVEEPLAAPALVDYGKAFWVIGIIHIVVNLAICWIPPTPRNPIRGP
ncbi:hypothetical protein SEPCBS119000_001690 [Sporothrix epigloea]|uniref:Major facilitator superfamily (MFS) profile domain-containing protein n=1 Tax=Sporothrix epigloea TaxID=1892477 RepID=A0ABP0DFB1_9PEZI